MYANFCNRAGQLSVFDRRSGCKRMSTMEDRPLHAGSDANTNGCYSEKENKILSVEMSTITISDQESRQCLKLIEKSIDMNGNVDRNNLMPESTQVVHLPEKTDQPPNGLNGLKTRKDKSFEYSELLDLLQNFSKVLVQNNTLQPLTNEFAELQNLVNLNLSHGKLTELPDTLSALKNLETLDLSHNQLESLPNSYASLRKLKKLDLSNNKFKAIPRCVRDGMITLKVLDISRNVNIKMNIIPCTKYLEKFHARDNGNCSKFPDWIVTPKFFNLTDVDLSRTKFDYYNFAGKEGDLSIKILTMTCSNLSNVVLDMMIENMICLEKMNISNEEDPLNSSGNIFSEIPVQAFKNPLTITELNFKGTCLPSVTPKINRLVNLKKLDVGSNSIMWLPDEICDLIKLEYLIIEENSMFVLPERIGDLKSLKVLKLGGNALVRLPDSFEKLNLRFLDLYNNKIEEFPSVLRKMTSLQGLDIEQNYFSTDDIKIGEKSYSELYESYLVHHDKQPKSVFDSRSKGAKKCESVKSDESREDVWCYNSRYRDWSSDEEDSARSYKSTKYDSDDNWETKKDTDDEFDPEDPKIKYESVKSKEYIHQQPQGFCPEDLHLKRIKSEVANMRDYGSLPKFHIEEGQFDDAE